MNDKEILELKIKELEESKNKLEMENNKLKKANERLEERSKKKSARINELEQTNSTLKKTVNEQKKSLKSAWKSIENLKRANKTEAYKDALKWNEILREEIYQLKREAKEREIVIEELRTKLRKNSSNSSKPSSTDSIYTKKIHKSIEKREKKTNGGQPNHKGVTFSKEDIEKLKEDKEVEYTVIEKGNTRSGKYKSKYIVDIKTIVTVTEYRYYEEEGKYNIPKEMEADVQYGANIKGLMVYLSTEMMSPLNKISRYFKDISKNRLKVSEGTIVNAQKAAREKLKPVVEEIKERLIKAEVLHVDETGVRINGKLNWLHTCCTKELVYYEVNEKRGLKSAQDIGILTFYVNILVHDHFNSYYHHTKITHAECNAHILRYLKAVIEIAKQEDAKALVELLLEMKKEKEEAIERGESKLKKKKIEEYSSEYSKIIEKWKKDLESRIEKEGKEKYKEEENLVKRLEKYKENHILFIKDFRVPFDNNLAERNLRMIKTKTKVSGGFRNEEGGKTFCINRSFIATCKSRTQNILEECQKVFRERTYNLV